MVVRGKWIHPQLIIFLVKLQPRTASTFSHTVLNRDGKAWEKEIQVTTQLIWLWIKTALIYYESSIATHIPILLKKVRHQLLQFQNHPRQA